MTVQLENVTIRYGEHLAVDDLSVTFGRGSIGLLGRNGAGKSSLLKALLGLVRPAAGTMRFSDLPVEASAVEIRAHVGYMPERDAHLPQATGFDMVSLLGMLSGLPRRDAWRRAHEVLYLVGLEEQRYRPVAGYSAGMRQKAKLAAALVHDPSVLFLDEPTNGLDPGGRSEMLELVRQMSQELGKSVVFSTHILQDVEAVCDQAVVLERGKVVAQGGIADLTAGGEREFRLRLEPASGKQSGAANVLEVLRASWRSEALGDGRYAVWLPDEQDTTRIFAAVHQASATVRSLHLKRRSLEDVFLTAVRSNSEPNAVTPSAVTPNAGTPSAVTPNAGTPSAGTPSAGSTNAGTAGASKASGGDPQDPSDGGAP